MESHNDSRIGGVRFLQSEVSHRAGGWGGGGKSIENGNKTVKLLYFFPKLLLTQTTAPPTVSQEIGALK